MKNIYLIIILCLLLANNMAGQTETEPNNTSEQANTLLYNGSQSGSINDADIVDWYKIKVDKGGIIKLLLLSDGGPEAYIYLSDSMNVGSSLGQAFLGFQERKRDSIIVPLLKGTYYVHINRSRGSGTYSIMSSLQILQYMEDEEPNNTFDKAGVLTSNGSVTGLIGHYSPMVKDYDPSDWYKLKVDKGGIIKLLLLSDGGPESYIFIADSTNLGSSLGQAFLGFQDRKRDSITVPVLKGTYYVYINRSRGSGSYSVTSSLQVLQYPEDEEPNNTFDKAGVLTNGGSVTGLIGHYSPNLKNYDPSDWYKLKVDKGGIIKLLFLSDGGPEAYIFISDSTNLGSSLGQAFLGFQDRKRDSIIVPVLKGTYYVYINLSRGSGSYSINSFFTFPKWQEDIEPNNDYVNSAIFAENAAISGLINYYNPAIKDYDPVDWYKIRVNNKGFLVIKLESDSSIEANMFLIDSLNLNSSIANAGFGFKDKTRDSLVAKVEKRTYFMALHRSRGSGAYLATSKLILLPKADFILNRTGNYVTFENTTVGDRTTYLWKFDDNTTATTINAFKEYKVPKNYNVCLIATNPAGADTICKMVVVPGVERISPAEGGNTGDVTIEIFGGGLDTNYAARIMNGNTVVTTSNFTGFSGSSSITVRFDLRTKPVGTYDFIIEKKGGNPSYKMTGGFKIVTGSKPNVWANIIGRNRILFNTWTTYTLNYGNTGNTDARVAPIWLAISDAPGLDVKFPETAIIDSDTIILAEGNEQDLYEEIDSLFGKPGKWRVYPMLFPLVAAGSNQTARIKIKSGGELKIHTWTEKPWFQSPLNDGKKGCTIDAISSSLVNHKDFIDCVTAYTFLILNRIYHGNEIEKDNYSFWLNLRPNTPVFSVLNKVINASLITCMNLLKKELPASTQKNIRKQVMTEILMRMLLLSDKPKAPPSVASYQFSLRNLSDCDTTEIEPQNPTSTTATTVNSLDPNEKAGPSGYGTNNYLRASNGFPYTIYFENKSTATAPAHQISITDKLDPAVFDLKSFSFGNVTIGDSTIYVPSGLRAFTLDKKLSHLNVIARVSGKLDTITGNIEWIFRSLDPKTLDDIEDPDIGILPPNKKSPVGEGNVTYFVKLKNEPRHGQQVKNKASIVFDANPAIVTNEHLVTFDLIPPQSSVMSLLPISATKFNIKWSGTDNGSGIQGYYIYYRLNGGADSLWLSNTTATSDTFTGKTGLKYEFWSVAVDNVGNVENKPSVPDAVTTITATHDENPDNSEILIYPNPAEDYLTIVNQSANKGCLTLVKTEGQVITRIYLQGQSMQQLHVGDISKGLLQWLWAPDCGVHIRSGRIVLIR